MESNFLQYVVVSVALAFIVGHSSERELRPSDHGLAYQDGSSPPAPNSGTKEMRAFFSGTPSAQLPEARNISGSWWTAHPSKDGARDLRKDHVTLGLIVGSAVCGVIGVALLAVSTVVYLRRRLQKQQHPESLKIPSTSASTSTV
ncbi:uncharacterized protein LOC127247169 [Andrographis paniculata]|uniref:uncharacterized protein LOC127247169 n=1 Tax=Andrographis paniculata TaxID=175694 RepID=UPI0021E9606B|nr:uncharacterized protein LOC127247169 [Andrographis paniculata]